MSQPTVLVTGATGFVGSHVVDQLLDLGYNVRATVRPGKVSTLSGTYPNAGTKLQVFEVGDLAEGDFTEALNGVEVLVHLAATTYVGGATPAEIVKGGVDGTLNVVNQAIKAGVKKIIFTSSYITLFGPDFARAFSSEPLTEKDWNTITIEQLDSNATGMAAYVAAKTVTERKFWELSEQHKDIDFTVIIPPGIYGPLLKTFPRPATRAGLSTVDFAYTIVTGEGEPNTWPENPVGNVVHVADVAKAHVLAVAAPPLTDGRKKRLIAASGTFTWQEAADLVRRERPELSSRLPKQDLTPVNQTSVPLDTSLTEEVLGIKSWISWDRAFLESLDSALEWEKGEPKA